MKNISLQLKKAVSIETLWSVNDFYDFLEKLENIGLNPSHWKDEENWATVSINDTMLLFCWRKYPLIFIQQKCFKKIKSVIDNFNDIVVIESNDLLKKEFCLDLDISLEMGIANRFDLNCFSANDFWFNTIS